MLKKVNKVMLLGSDGQVIQPYPDIFTNTTVANIINHMSGNKVVYLEFCDKNSAEKGCLKITREY